MSRSSLPLALAATLLCPISLLSQVSFGGMPIGLSQDGTVLPDASVVTLPTPDIDALLAEDAERLATGVKAPWRFGHEHVVDIGIEDHGTWHALRGGDRVWQLSIACPEALSINFTFSTFVVPEGGLVFVYNEAGEHLGAFTSASAGGHQRLGVGLLPGDRITIEYIEPAAVSGQGDLRIGQVVHGYRHLGGPGMQRGFGDSGDCNIDVICPLGDAWRDQIASVALIMAGGGTCTGQLINNCAQDGTPYFLTADHCLVGDVADWVFVFNWESPTCDPTENAPMDQSVSGSQLLVSSADTDVALLLLNSTPPAEYEVYYTGWDRTGIPPFASIGIHHPAGDIKKICADYDEAEFATWSGAECWRVVNWEEGTTEPGSSGSGLWNDLGLLVGQLFGGSASCTSDTDDFYGRFDLSYPLMSQWLGECGDLLFGYPEGVVPPPDWDAAITTITNMPDVLCNENSITPRITIKNNGVNDINTLTLSYGTDLADLFTQEWLGNILSGQTHNHFLPAIPVENGDQELTVICSLPNGNVDQVTSNDTLSRAFRVSAPGLNMQLQLVQDIYGQDITWTLETEDGDLLHSGGPYPNFANGVVRTADFCLTNGCYVFTIFDSFGDGICCENGEGSYVIVDDEGNEWVNGNGEYTFSESHVFCLEALGVAEEQSSGQLQLWPNPANDQLNVLIPEGLSGTADIRLLDLTGRELRHWRTSGARLAVLDMPAGHAGMLLLEVIVGDSRLVERIVLLR